MIAHDLPRRPEDDPSKPSRQTYTLLPIYGAAQLQTGTTAEGSHSTLAGYVESKPGRNFAIVLTWRTKKGKLSKAWSLSDELVALYWFDGRPHPSMRYGESSLRFPHDVSKPEPRLMGCIQGSICREPAIRSLSLACGQATKPVAHFSGKPETPSCQIHQTQMLSRRIMCFAMSRSGRQSRNWTILPAFA